MSTQLRVIVPDKLCPGMDFHVRTPSGELLRVTVPNGTVAGQYVTIAISQQQAQNFQTEVPFTLERLDTTSPPTHIPDWTNQYGGSVSALKNALEIGSVRLPEQGCVFIQSHRVSQQENKPAYFIFRKSKKGSSCANKNTKKSLHACKPAVQDRSQKSSALSTSTKGQIKAKQQRSAPVPPPRTSAMNLAQSNLIPQVPSNTYNGRSNFDGLVMRDHSKPSSCTSGQSTTAGICINGRRISPQHLTSCPELARIPAGKYWHDFKSGAWGSIGGPCLGVVRPGRAFPGAGPLSATASGKGATNIFVNGRELHPIDVIGFTRLGVRCMPGRWSIDALGTIRMESTGIIVGNVTGGAGGGNRNNNFWSTGFSAGNSTADGSSGYVHVPGHGCVSYGM